MWSKRKRTSPMIDLDLCTCTWKVMWHGEAGHVKVKQKSIPLTKSMVEGRNFFQKGLLRTTANAKLSQQTKYYCMTAQITKALRAIHNQRYKSMEKILSALCGHALRLLRLPFLLPFLFLSLVLILLFRLRRLRCIRPRCIHT